MTSFEIHGQTFRLLHQKAVFWEDRKCLIISDLHLGKSHHFRKGGVALPKTGDRQNLQRLRSLIEVLRPEELLLLGDLFHSDENAHVEEAARFMEGYTGLRKRLVIGNHDIMDPGIYNKMGLELSEEEFLCGPFRFRHEPVAAEDHCLEAVDLQAGSIESAVADIGAGSGYVISGHIHPGVRLKGRGRQSVILPCFWFGSRQAVLPAFGNFTGLYPIRPAGNDRIFTIAGRRIMDLGTG